MATLASKLPQSWRIPPHVIQTVSWLYEQMSGLLSYFLFHLLIYVCLVLFGGKEARPPECIEYRRYIFEKRLVYCTGGTYLNVFIFFACANLAGQLMEFIGLPGSIGMVLSGCGLRWFADLTYHAEIIRGPLPSSWWNIFWTTNQTHTNLKFIMKCSIMVMDEDIFARLRQIALATVITRAGLSLNPSLVKQISGGIARMPIIPCLIEGLLTMPIYKYWVKLPWAWAIMLSCMMAATSTVVAVPSSVQLRVASWGLDDVLVMVGFGMAYSVEFARGSLVDRDQFAIKTLAGGAIVGIVLGVLLWFYPDPNMEHGTALRASSVILAAVALLLGTATYKRPAAGALASILFSFIASVGCQRGWEWPLVCKREGMASTTEPNVAAIERGVACLKTMRLVADAVWWFVQPLCFAFLGAHVSWEMFQQYGRRKLAVKLLKINSMAVAIRVILAFLSKMCSDVPYRQRIFLAIAWMPKITLQAIFAGMTLDAAKKNGNDSLKSHGYMFVQIVLASILLFSPLWTLFLVITTPFLLK